MKALEKNRERRYETASGFALDIQRHLQNEPVSARPPTTVYRISRLVRRNRLAFATAGLVGLSLLAGAIISAAQARRAERAEQVAAAERSRAIEERVRAEDLLGFMLGDLRAQLAKVGRLDVLESASDKAMAYFSTRKAEGLDDSALARYAKALTQIGEIRMEQERYPEALAAFAEAYDRSSALALRNPRSGDFLFERGQAEYWNGYVNWNRGEFALAAVWLNRYHDTCIALVALDPLRPLWQSELAYGNHNLAALNKERGEFAASRTGFLAELATLEKMGAQSPDDLEIRYRTADAHSWLGGLALQQGELSEALSQYAAQATILEGLVLAEPRTARWRFRLADTQLYRTEVLMAMGRFAEAREQLVQAQAPLNELTKHDPGNRHWLIALLHSRVLEAELARQRRDWTVSEGVIGDIRPQLEKLSAAEPSDRVLERWTASASRIEAQLDLAADLPGASDAAGRAVDKCEKLVHDGRATDADLGECALSSVVRGQVSFKAGDTAAARHLWEHAAELLAPQLGRTQDWRFLDPAARAALYLGRSNAAQAIIAQLDKLGYVPLDPWPPSNRLDAASAPSPQL